MKKYIKRKSTKKMVSAELGGEKKNQKNLTRNTY